MTSYSPESKADAVAYVRDYPKMSVPKCAADLGANVNTLHGWLTKIWTAT